MGCGASKEPAVVDTPTAKPDPTPEAKKIEDPPAKVIEETPVKKVEEPAPSKKVEPAPAKKEEPAPAKKEEPAPAKKEEPAPIKKEEPAPAKKEEPSRSPPPAEPVAAAVEPTPAKAEGGEDEVVVVSITVNDDSDQECYVKLSLVQPVEPAAATTAAADVEAAAMPCGGADEDATTAAADVEAAVMPCGGADEDAAAAKLQARIRGDNDRKACEAKKAAAAAAAAGEEGSNTVRMDIKVQEEPKEGSYASVDIL